LYPFAIGVIQAGNVEELDTMHIQCRSRCRQDIDPRRCVQYINHQVRSRHQVFEVVQDLQHSLVAQEAQKLHAGLGGTLEGETQGVGQGGHDELGGVQGGQIDKTGAVFEMLGSVTGGRQLGS
jgi:hypothetical protein